jgi:effector-binding domain-containing protein
MPRSITALATSAIVAGFMATAASPEDAPTRSETTAPAAAAAAAPSPAELPVVVGAIEAMHAIVLPMKGSYMQHEEAFMKLHHQLLALAKEPLGHPFARYFNSVDEVDEAELLWEVGFPIVTGVETAAPFEIKDIPGGLTASFTHNEAPEMLGESWAKLMRWAATKGFRPAGPATMVFLGEPGPNGMRVELRLPVVKID